MIDTNNTTETMDELEVKILKMQEAAIQAFILANANFLKAVEGIDVSNRSGTNAGNFLTQIVAQAKNNSTQLDNLLKHIDSSLNPATENFGGTNGGVAPSPSRL